MLTSGNTLPLESMGFSVLCCLEPHRKKVFFAIGFYSIFKVCDFAGKISLKPSSHFRPKSTW